MKRHALDKRRHVLWMMKHNIRIAGSKPRFCSWCGSYAETFCPVCTEKFPQRPDSEKMTGDERAAEMQALKITEVEFSLIHQRIEALVGRPVWTHEIGLCWKELLEEARGLRKALPVIPLDQVLGVDPRGEAGAGGRGLMR